MNASEAIQEVGKASSFDKVKGVLDNLKSRLFFSRDQVQQYSNLALNESVQVADAFAEELIKALDLPTPAERGNAWEQIRKIWKENISEIRKKQASLERSAKKNKRTIRKTVTELLDKRLNSSEDGFVRSIMGKRVLTAKQGKWLDDICLKYSVEKAEYGDKKPAKVKVDCQHEDLGSLGYRHGEVVKCPYCGDMAEVW